MKPRNVKLGPERHPFLGYAIRSFLETVAAQRLAVRRGYHVPADLIARSDAAGEELFRELQAFRSAVRRRIAAKRRK